MSSLTSVVLIWIWICKQTVSEYCDYFSKRDYSVAAFHTVFNQTIIYNGIIDIRLSILLNQYCNITRCIILQIENHEYQFLSLSINGIYDYFQVEIANKYEYCDVIRIPNAQAILPTDSQYHILSISHSNVDETNTQTIFSVDTESFTYTTSIPSNTETYQVNIGTYDTELEAEINNICINSSIPGSKLNNTTPCSTCSGEIKCNQIVTQHLEAHESVLLYFNATQNMEVLFYANGTCSECSIKFNLYQMIYDMMILQKTITGTLWSFADITLGEYVFEMENTYASKGGVWNVAVNCVNIFPESYRIVVDRYVESYRAEYHCENFFGTTLATIITNQDLMNVTEQAKAILKQFQNVTLWIGMYKKLGTDNQWNWLDGKSCNYTVTDLCEDDIHWAYNHPDSGQNFLRNDKSFGAYLSVESDDLFDSNMYNEHSSYGFICNGPKSQYKIQQCKTISKCWIRMNCCDDFALVMDTVLIPDSFTPPIAYWNSNLFVIGMNDIHYTKFHMFTNESMWSHSQYNRYNVTVNLMTAQRWSQTKSVLYLYVQEKLHDTLISINLDSLETEYFVVPAKQFSLMVVEVYCMVSSPNFVYIIRPEGIFVFDIVSLEWRIDTTNEYYFLNDYLKACAITLDYKFIYLFGAFYGIIKYETSTAKWNTLNSINMCKGYLTEVGRTTSPARAITAPNGKIYIHGCDIPSWKTLVFDPKIEEFEKETIDIGSPNDIANYRKSQLTVFDDNILLLLNAPDPWFPSFVFRPMRSPISTYYALTEIRSINFHDTIFTESIWPSDGFQINYYLNDFGNDARGIYDINFFSNNSIVMAVITLNTSKDNCICNKTNYTCYNCAHHFYLNKYLSAVHNNIETLTFIPSAENIETLILPNIIVVPLKRCLLQFIDIDKSTTNKNPNIKFLFTLSQDCYSRSGTTFLLDIISPLVHIMYTLNITTFHNKTKTCQLCDMKKNICNKCNGNEFMIRHDIKNITKNEFTISIQSKMIDLRVIPENHTIQYFMQESQSDLQFKTSYLLILLVPFGILIFSICGILVYYKKQYDKAYVIDKALVLIIGCSQFDNKKSFLPGVQQNIFDLKNLWENDYNYHVFVCNEMSLYSNKYQIIHFIDEYKEKLNASDYKCVIVHVISHGNENGFISSDHKNVSFDFIQHELIDAAQYSDNSGIIKIIFNHSCRGTENYSHTYEIESVISMTDHDTDEEKQPIVSGTRGLFDNSTSVTKKNENVPVYSESNWAIISANVPGRTVSDLGHFTKCICNSFRINLKRECCNALCAWKYDLDKIIKEIGRNLEQMTNQSELLNINGTLREDIRFEICNSMSKRDKKLANIELYPLSNNEAYESLLQ
eukprot:141968_1